jgi:hypothetical protein
MDALDQAIVRAWAALAPKLREDRAEAIRRAGRVRGAVLRRPVRAWCCCVRASDTRIKAGDGREGPHTVRLSAARLRSLCAPVHIDWPGERWTIVADKMGLHPESLRSLMKRGVFRSCTVHPNVVGSRGKPVPMLWTVSPVDPNAEVGRCPDPHWGTLWLHLHEQIPEGASIVARRVPVVLPYPRRDGSTDHRFRGFRFLCPGLTEGTACGRSVSRLYLPIPMLTIHHINHAELSDLREDARDTRWACRFCHRIKPVDLGSKVGWNEFVAHVSGGLLYGHEVQQPASFKAEVERRRVSRRRVRNSKG